MPINCVARKQCPIHCHHPPPLTYTYRNHPPPLTYTYRHPSERLGSLDTSLRWYDGARSKKYDGARSKKYDGARSKKYDGARSKKYDEARSKKYDVARGYEAARNEKYGADIKRCQPPLA